MITQVTSAQSLFYREFLTTRGKFNPMDFGVNMDREAFTDQMVSDFAAVYRDSWTIDELCLHPVEC